MDSGRTSLSNKTGYPEAVGHGSMRRRSGFSGPRTEVLPSGRRGLYARQGGGLGQGCWAGRE